MCLLGVRGIGGLIIKDEEDDEGEDDLVLSTFLRTPGGCGVEVRQLLLLSTIHFFDYFDGKGIPGYEGWMDECIGGVLHRFPRWRKRMGVFTHTHTG